MPLLNHFREPASEDFPWTSHNTLWVAEIVGALNHSLPRDRYRAFANRHLSIDIAADIAEFDLRPQAQAARGNGGIANAGIALASFTASAMQTMPAIFPDDIEIHINDARNRRKLVAVIEMVSPANKKEKPERDAFVAKCAAYLHKGIGLMIVDVVTERKANLHDEMLKFLEQSETFAMKPPARIYVTSYRPVRRRKKDLIDLWKFPLQIDEPLPTAPLCLTGGPIHPLDLESTYLTALDKGGMAPGHQ